MFVIKKPYTGHTGGTFKIAATHFKARGGLKY